MSTFQLQKIDFTVAQSHSDWRTKSPV